MSREIICPYCFKKMGDEQVLFRSDRVESDTMPAELEERLADYEGVELQEKLEKQYREWDFFRPQVDPIYKEFWDKYGGGRDTTEYTAEDEKLGIKAYKRKVLDPNNEEHCEYLLMQESGEYFLRDNGMVTGVQLKTGEICDRRVCRFCRNPLPRRYGKFEAKFISVIGITGSGKTVWLTQLMKNMLHYVQTVGLAIPIKSPSVAEFVEKHEVTPGKPLPGATPGEQLQQPLFFELVKDVSDGKKKTYTIVLYDVSGEELKDPHRVKKYAQFIRNSDGILLLIDSQQFVNQQIASGGLALDEPTEIMTAVYDEVAHGADDDKCKTPFAVCISKMDDLIKTRQFTRGLTELLERPRTSIPNRFGFAMPLFNAEDYNPIFARLFNFFRDNETDLWQTMNNCFSDYAYFAFSALGCEPDKGEDGKTKYAPKTIQPMRVEEPLLWILHRLDFIGAEPDIKYPYRYTPILCPICGKPMVKIPEAEREIRVKTGLLKWERQYHNYRCPEGHREFIEEEDESGGMSDYDY